MSRVGNRYGLLAEFDSPEQLLMAAEQVHRAGYQHVDAFTPFPVEGLTQRLGIPRTRLPWLVLAGAVAGGLAGYGLQVYVSVWAYPLNVGGRPLHSWPAFLPVTFELAILGAALAAVFGMLFCNGLPRPHHPLFAVPRFARATLDSFFLCVN